MMVREFVQHLRKLNQRIPIKNIRRRALAIESEERMRSIGLESEMIHGSGAFEPEGGPLAAAYAKGGERTASAGFTELMQGC